MDDQPIAASPQAIEFTRTLMTVFGILVIASGVSLSIGWFASSDVKGWWPFFLAIQVFFSLIYSLIIAAINNASRNPSLRFTAVSTIFLAAVQFVHACFYYYARPDWLAVNEGRAALTLLQNIVYWHGTPYTIYGIFLIIFVFRTLKHKS